MASAQGHLCRRQLQRRRLAAKLAPGTEATADGQQLGTIDSIQFSSIGPRDSRSSSSLVAGKAAGGGTARRQQGSKVLCRCRQQCQWQRGGGKEIGSLICRSIQGKMLSE
eukprot:gene9682-biopygen4288